MFSNIAVYIDSSVDNSVTLAQTTTLALSKSAKVTLIGVSRPVVAPAKISMMPDVFDSIDLAVQQSLAEALDQAKAQLCQQGLNVGVDILSGEPFIEIIRSVLTHKFDLVVITAAAKPNRIAETFFGSTQMHLLRKCPCPVWIVKGSASHQIKKIITSIDTLSDEPEEGSVNQNLINGSKVMVDTFSPQIDFLQVWALYGEGHLQVRGGVSEQKLSAMREQLLRQYKEALSAYIEEHDWTGIKLTKNYINSNYPSDEILTKVESDHPDLLIMGTVCRTGISGFFIGNTAERVLNQVSCSVLAFKPNNFITPITLE